MKIKHVVIAMFLAFLVSISGLAQSRKAGRMLPLESEKTVSEFEAVK